MRRMNIFQWVIIKLVWIYRYTLRPFLPKNTCKYTPSCSEYMLQAVKMHGALRGFMMGVCRIWRCSPWGKGGDDPVPLKRS